MNVSGARPRSVWNRHVCWLLLSGFLLLLGTTALHGREKWNERRRTLLSTLLVIRVDDDHAAVTAGRSPNWLSGSGGRRLMGTVQVSPERKTWERGSTYAKRAARRARRSLTVGSSRNSSSDTSELGIAAVVASTWSSEYSSSSSEPTRWTAFSSSSMKDDS